ncbi:glycoside hydrolase family 35 protein [Cohnella silvisoli]|uniref:Beta-galactosidase n=1 Tax=Cohnella silvisoli TaxID=2873699 RepID=A0ABV1L1N3_9BACL|nr:beta-galactosidase family protein [Cohnella silvisoli]MCD9025424.1 beta-galactosidase [Cohnella silvisoli]
MPILSYNSDSFLLDGQPFRILSGAMHYFRIVPEYWEDRLAKLKACGLNTVETYIPWNLHEPKQGEYCFEGLADVTKFIEKAASIGLHVILRPSPYICSEWEFGGLPSWLLAEPDMKIRCFHRPYLDKLDAYYDVLLPRLKPYLSTNGGPVIALQIENEYGSYGNDRSYLLYLKQAYEKRGMDVLLFTSDGPMDYCLQSGMISDTLATVNFGSKANEAFSVLKQYQPNKPVMCMEFWNGWFDHWGKPHIQRESGDAAAALEEILAAGGSVNFYMFHGGTNFGFYNGANFADRYEAIVTSYDFDAPLNECGDPTAKYFAIREVLSKYGDLQDRPLPAASSKKTYGTVRLTEQSALFDNLDQLSESVQSVYPQTMERLGQDYGFILYTTHVSGPKLQCELVIEEVRDRAIVYVNDEFKGILERWHQDTTILFDIPAEGARIDILVENMGRVNYGPRMIDTKGITQSVRLVSIGWWNHLLFDWSIRPLPLTDLNRLQYQPVHERKQGRPTFYRGAFNAVELADTFMELEGWTKGVAYVNGFNLGRYWNAGPQKTLYVPAPLLRLGSNEIVIFELHGTDSTEIRMVDAHIVG